MALPLLTYFLRSLPARIRETAKALHVISSNFQDEGSQQGCQEQTTRHSHHQLCPLLKNTEFNPGTLSL